MNHRHGEDRNPGVLWEYAQCYSKLNKLTFYFFYLLIVEIPQELFNCFILGFQKGQKALSVFMLNTQLQVLPGFN